MDATHSNDAEHPIWGNSWRRTAHTCKEVPQVSQHDQDKWHLHRYHLTDAISILCHRQGDELVQ